MIKKLILYCVHVLIIVCIIFCKRFNKIYMIPQILILDIKNLTWHNSLFCVLLDQIQPYIAKNGNTVKLLGHI